MLNFIDRGVDDPETGGKSKPTPRTPSVSGAWLQQKGSVDAQAANQLLARVTVSRQPAGDFGYTEFMVSSAMLLRVSHRSILRGYVIALAAWDHACDKAAEVVEAEPYKPVWRRDLSKFHRNRCPSSLALERLWEATGNAEARVRPRRCY